MLNITENKTREHEEGQFFVELIRNRGLDIVNWDRLGYWCDKPHLKHMLKGIGKAFTQDELKDLLNIKGEQYQPKDGDIVFIPGYDDLADRIAIVKDKDSEDCYAFYNLYRHKLHVNSEMYKGCNHPNVRPATEDERNTLLDALENDGFRWDDKKKQLEKIPVRPKEGDLAIAWNIGNHRNAIIGTYHLAACAKANVGDSYFNHCCKFESMEQYESIRRGEYD